jgi:hypothetical protein
MPIFPGSLATAAQVEVHGALIASAAAFRTSLFMAALAGFRRHFLFLPVLG